MPQVFFKNQPVTLEKNLISVGSHMPNIKFTMQNLEEKDLSSFKDDKLILWFVPSLDTGTCVLSAKHLNEHLKKHPSTQALILSMDLPFAQSRVCGLEGLNQVKTASLFRHQQTLASLGLMIDSGPLKGLSARCVMVLDSHHNITYIDLVSEITHEPNYTKLFHFLGH